MQVALSSRLEFFQQSFGTSLNLFGRERDQISGGRILNCLSKKADVMIIPYCLV